MPFTRSFDASVAPDPATGLFNTSLLAKGLGVRPATVKTMRARGQVPEPTATIGGSYVWAKEEIYRFYGVRNTQGETRLEGIPPADPALPQVVDLFSGCGGLSLGFQRSGFDILAGFDNWSCAVDTYKANMGHEAYLLDLSDISLTIETLGQFFASTDQTPALIGGPPCQDFSSAGKRREGARADLTEKYANIVAHFMPPFFVMENVARAKHAAAFKSAVSTFERAGYFVRYLVIDSSRVGVPQTRKRLITVGTPSEKLTETIFDALIFDQSEHQTTVREYFSETLGTPLEIDFYYRHPRSYARRGVFSVDEPSPTIRGVNRPIPTGYPGHSGDAGPIHSARPLSTAERSLIQTFPRNFQWVGSRTAVEQMIGNAVPVELGAFIGRSIARALSSPGSAAN
ncbi:DNA (cytosine-5-)-methyltransferase [Corynebacterium sanguinis]|uniref:DNA cytosine methyltransferase n=2 Tax=Corynebacteriaceae TaxID=1653 RepID=UPI0021AE5874|nr:DNA (cytosine-5-)-methyltransferase [Corynebacterium sanguinis]MCT1425925.1 DNA (cytosine-5-)-methyltransferase [Corynebacterium sanguinis]